MERVPEERRTDPDTDQFVDRVREHLEEADAGGDDQRLETLETVRADLEEELDSSLENGPTRH